MSGSREIQQIKTLERKRALYRMVFGVADPEHLLGELGANTTITPEVALQTSIRLGAWERKFAS